MTITATADLKVGDYLVSQWGYDQTNITYYLVIGTTAKTVRLREMRNTAVEVTGYLSERVVPSDEPMTVTEWNAQTGERTQVIRELRRTIKTDGSEPYVKISDYEYAYPWSGHAKTATHTH